MKEYKDFGSRLKDLRKKKFKTQEIFAEKMEVSVDSVRNWEQGRVLPEQGTLFKISELLDCDLDYLTGRIEEKTHDLQFISETTGLSPKAVKKLSEMPTDYQNVVSLLLEDLQSEYILSLIDKRIKNDPKTLRPGKNVKHADLIQDDLYLDIDDQRILTKKYNLLDSLIQTEVLHILPIVSEAYRNNSVKSNL